MAISEFYRPKEKELRFKRISMDIDGVVVLSFQKILDYVNQKYGTNYLLEDIKGFHWIERTLQEKLGVSAEEANSIWFHPEPMLNSEPVPGAIRAIQALSLRGAELFFVTARPPVLKETTYQWFAEHLPFVNKERIFVGPDSTLAGADKFKIQTIKSLGVDLHIEDSLQMAKALDGIPVVVLNWFWNQEGDAKIRKNSWFETYQFALENST